MKEAVVLDAVELVEVKRGFEILQGSCRAKRRKVSITVAQAVALADEIVRHVGVSRIPDASNVSFGTAPVAETEVVLRTTNLKKTRQEAANA